MQDSVLPSLWQKKLSPFLDSAPVSLQKLPFWAYEGLLGDATGWVLASQVWGCELACALKSDAWSPLSSGRCLFRHTAARDGWKWKAALSLWRFFPDGLFPS